uniref:Reverse transcriptase Ty1/copia-type domain-containing protein n=1 Tax=Tanacetum cinerariifolium TaxID=118510 RepID=A0A6L2KCF0_TANCI|nr:hypothetical protein [Tanacetum cinerariifolium]
MLCTMRETYVDRNLKPLPAVPAADAEANVLAEWNALYDAYNEELKSMFEKQAKVRRFDLIQTFHACKQEDGKPVDAYVLQMKGYVDQLERLDYMLPQDLIVGLILNGLNKDFTGFVRNYSMYNMKKTIGELHAMLIEYEKGLPKKAETSQVMMIKGVYIPKPKNPKPAAKENPAKDDTCHHCKELCHWKRNCPVYFAELLKKKKQVALPVLQDYALESTPRILNMVPAMKVDTTPYELWYGKVPNLSYLKETMGYYFYFPPENKTVIARYAEFFEKNLITQEVSRKAVDLEEIQDEDTPPSDITSKIPMDVEGSKPPQEEVIPIRRSERTHRALNRLCLNVEVEDHSLWDLNEPASYKAVLVDLPSNCKTVRSKWIFKKKTDMDGIVHAYKALLVVKGYTQLYGVDYEEIFSSVADIRAIRILISIAAYYDYGIWKMDVKTTFLNGYLDEDIYMVQPEGFVDPNHPKKASGSNVTFLIVYVDDIIIIGNHIPSLQSVKDYFGKCFAMKDLEEAAFILGIKIYRDRSKRLIRLSQDAYMDKIKRHKIDNSKRGHIPMQERLDLNKRQDMFLVYGGNPKAELRDAGLETDRDDTKYETGYVFILNRGTVNRKSSKQSITAMSAT